MSSQKSRYVAVCGGVGGAKLALGLSEVLGARVSIIVNTGDDFDHLGLHISPDIDTVVYTLGGLANDETGWGRAAESWSFMEALRDLGGPGWFQLGDKDLAMHVERTRWLAGGGTLSGFCAHIRQKLGIAPAILPMSDDPVRTMLDTDQGTLAFQDYFVARKCEPQVNAIRYEGAQQARPLPAAFECLADPELAGVIICPSNPYLSIDPILSMPGMCEAIEGCTAPVIAVTPLIGGKAVKGPTAKLMGELGYEVTPQTIAAHYGALIDGFILDQTDASDAAGFLTPVRLENTLMTDRAVKISLARAVIAFCEMLQFAPRARVRGA